MAKSNDRINDEIEAAFWEFDARRKGTGQFAGATQGERHAFKMAVHGAARRLAMIWKEPNE